MTGKGSRPKTSAGIQLLLKSIVSEVESLQQRHQVWIGSTMVGTKQDVTQVGAILADLERKLNDVLQAIADLKKMWGKKRRQKSSRSRDSNDSETVRSGSRSSNGSRVSRDELQLPLIKESGRSTSDLKVSDCDTSNAESSQCKAHFEPRMLKRRESTCMQPSSKDQTEPGKSS